MTALQRTLYAAHMNVAQHAWEDGNIQRVQELLEEHRPKAGESDLRGFEWYYLDRLCHAEILTLKGHASGVLSVVYSPDGKRLASVVGGPGIAPEVKVWDAQTGQELLTIKGAGWSLWPSARTANAWPPALRTWDDTRKTFVTGEREGCGMPRPARNSSPSRALAAAWSSARTASAWPPVAATWDDTKRAEFGREVKVWDAQTGQELLTIKGLTDSVWSVAFSPDGKRLATGASDSGGEGVGCPDRPGTAYPPRGGGVGVPAWLSARTVSAWPASGEGRTVKVWDAQTGQELLSCKGHNGQINSVAFSPDGKRLASAGWDRMVKVWDAQTGQELLTYKGHSRHDPRAWRSVPTGPGWPRAAWDGTVKVWDATTSPEARTFREPISGVLSVAFSPDGKRLAGASSGQYGEGPHGEGLGCPDRPGTPHPQGRTG